MADPAASFESALALQPAGDGHLVADIPLGWDVRGNPHGGYLLALVARAMGRVVAQPHPLSVSASYLAPPRMGPADLFVEIARAGRRQSTASVRLVQDGIERVRADGTFGELGREPASPLADDVVPPPVPPPELCLDTAALETAEGEEIRLHRRLLLRFHPDTGWLRGAPSGVPALHGWMALADGTAPDPAALLLFSDGFPPSMFEAAGRVFGHVPTVQLTTHVFGLPAPGWVQGRFRTRVRGGSFVDEDGELWDARGQLVATTRQLALLRPPAPS
ncbi:MAG: thioesterase family protein [Acidimicrobiia bacterium]|nr:thioesterase family protein [Acidimicrobiia bacterium]